MRIQGFQTVEVQFLTKTSHLFSKNPQPIPKTPVEGNCGNFGNVKSFHSFAPVMEEQDIKQRILVGATELFLRYGIRSVSMDDVARHLSVSKKTLYQYFADKDEIVTTVAAFKMEDDRKKYDGFRQSSKNAIEELARISGCIKVDFQKMNPS